MSKRRTPDPRGGHVRLYWAIIDSPAWKALNFSQQALYIAARRRLSGNSNGNISLGQRSLADQGFEISVSGLAAALRALKAVGLIAVTRDGGNVGRGQTIPTLYRFTDEASHEWRTLHIPSFNATNDWRRFSTVEEAGGAILVADAESRRRGEERKERAEQKEKSSIRNSYRDDSKNEHGTIRKTKTEAISVFENRIVSRRHKTAASLMQ